MPNWGYSIKNLDPAKGVRASGREMRISPKASREICAAIRNMNLQAAKDFLEQVIDLKRAVPFKRHKKQIPHRRGLEGWYAGKYPVKAARAILKVLNGLEANAEDKGLDKERLRIIHAAAQLGMRLKKGIPRAHGRSSPFDIQLTHVELAAIEL